MTHTIHPKMLEKVESALEDILCGIDVSVNNLISEAARAAILAMWEGLPIEDLSREEIAIGTDSSGEYGVIEYCDLSKQWQTIGDEYGVAVTNPTRFIPIPTQEAE